MYSANNNSPSDESCGTPISKQVVADWPEPYLTNTERLSRYVFSHCTAASVMPTMNLSRLMGVERSIVSKVTDMSSAMSCSASVRPPHRRRAYFDCKYLVNVDRFQHLHWNGAIKIDVRGRFSLTRSASAVELPCYGWFAIACLGHSVLPLQQANSYYIYYLFEHIRQSIVDTTTASTHNSNGIWIRWMVNNSLFPLLSKIDCPENQRNRQIYRTPFKQCSSKLRQNACTVSLHLILYKELPIKSRSSSFFWQKHSSKVYVWTNFRRRISDGYR